MAHIPRFYIEPAQIGETPIRLEDAEAHHAIHVVRVKVGDAIKCFDGVGTNVEGTVSGVERAAVTVESASTSRVPEPAIQLTLIQAWLHREKAIEEVIKRGTELGVTRFVFFRADHSERAPKSSDKWTKWAIESCKQCGRSWLPAFDVAQDLTGALNSADKPILVATQHRDPVPLRRAINGLSASLVIGPEGDLSEDELAVAEAHSGYPVSLGDSVFRAEVAATALTALILYEMGGIGPVDRE